MNAPTRAVELVQPQVELIPVASIAPSDTHIQQLRRKRYDMEGLANLTASVRKLGVQQPGIVRKLTALRGLASYELVCGERRWRASRQADVAHFPAIVRDLSDADVLEVQLVENLQRESLHPLEEAAGYDELMKVGKITADQVGDRVGLSRSWVYSRLNLLKLDAPAQQALQDGRLDVSRALVVASVAQPNQRAEALRLALERGFNDKPMYSVRELRHKIGEDQLTKPLTGAPFPIADASLFPDRGACGPCRFRTANCDPDALDPDVCTNLSCFHLKVKAQAERVRQAAADAGRKILRGEDARKLSPSPLTVYGHVDLDNICEHDLFPEKAPELPEMSDAGDEEFNQHPLLLAYNERERLWQPRTYRALLEGTKYSSVLIECPKTKGLLRELVPFKEAQALLKKRGIELPSYANKKRQSSQAGAPKGESRAKAQERYEDQERRRNEERELREELRRRVCKAAFPKLKAKLDRELLVDLVRQEFHIDRDELELLTGETDLRKVAEADLVRLMRIRDALHESPWLDKPKALSALASATGVNLAAIQKQLAKEHAAATKKADK